MAATSEAKYDISVEQQKAEVDAVLASQTFTRAPRHSKLLRYLADKHFSGHDRDVKEFSIATEVLGRGSDFDQGKDAIVRVEMHRLRKRLKDFYDCEGASHAIELVIHPGQYLPCFIMRPSADAEVIKERESKLPEVPVEPEARRFHVAPRLQIGIVIVLVLLAGVGLAALRTNTIHSAVVAGPITQPAAATVAGLGPDSEVRILCGFKKDRYIDREGKLWGPDAFGTGGYTEERPRQYFARTQDPILYQTERIGEFSYDIPAKPGKYELWLYFAETAYGPETTTGGGENSRVFNVLLNGKLLLDQFDIFSDAGGANIADIRRFKNVSPADDGKVHLQFDSVRGHPLLNAIRLSPMEGDRQAPIRIVAQESSYTDSHGALWAPDSYFSGGQYSTHKDPVKGTPDSDLYAGERYGHFSYAIPVDPAGTYNVNVYLAETYWGPNSPGRRGGVGTRVFDIFCNGTALLRNVDLYKEYGAFQAAKRSFRGLKANSQGKLNLSFIPVANYASVYAIEVLEE